MKIITTKAPEKVVKTLFCFVHVVYTGLSFVQGLICFMKLQKEKNKINVSFDLSLARTNVHIFRLCVLFNEHILILFSHCARSSINERYVYIFSFEAPALI